MQFEKKDYINAMNNSVLKHNFNLLSSESLHEYFLKKNKIVIVKLLIQNCDTTSCG